MPLPRRLFPKLGPLQIQTLFGRFVTVRSMVASVARLSPSLEVLHPIILKSLFAFQVVTHRPELVALLLASHHSLNFLPFDTFHVCSDSISALQGIQHHHGLSSLSETTKSAYLTIGSLIPHIFFWWIPGHSSIPEHNLSDATAKTATHDSSLHPCH